MWYVLAAISYVLVGIWHKWLLNWLIGPIWLVVTVVVGPWSVDRLKRRQRPVRRRSDVLQVGDTGRRSQS